MRATTIRNVEDAETTNSYLLNTTTGGKCKSIYLLSLTDLDGRIIGVMGIHYIEKKHKIGGKSPKDFFTYLLDHTTIVASDDPYLDKFVQMDKDGIIQLRVLPATGCERFAEYLYRQINRFLKEETKGRVRAIKVEVYEHDRNSASYMETQNTTKQEEMLSLYDYLGRPAGSELGKKVAEVATKLKVSINVREVQTKTYKGQVLLYPKSFLESYFKPKTVTPELLF